MIAAPVAQALARGRERYNARFAELRRAHAMDGEAFLAHVASHVAPVIGAVAEVAPHAIEPVLEALYELSLELFTRELAGPKAKSAAVADGLARVLVSAPHLLVAAPDRLPRSVGNALAVLAARGEPMARSWAGRMSALAPLAADPETFLELGRVLGWCAGLAEQRSAALSTAARLPPPLVAAALGLPEHADVAAVSQQMAANPWLTPCSAATPPESPMLLRLARVVGGFRGFGGPFLTPPRITVEDDVFFASDEERCHALFADVFGAALLPAGRAGDAPPPHRGPLSLDPSGQLNLPGGPVFAPELAGASSSASTRSTLAVTFPWSCGVYLFGWAA